MANTASQWTQFDTAVTEASGQHAPGVVISEAHDRSWSPPKVRTVRRGPVVVTHDGMSREVATGLVTRVHPDGPYARVLLGTSDKPEWWALVDRATAVTLSRGERVTIAAVRSWQTEGDLLAESVTVINRTST